MYSWQGIDLEHLVVEFLGGEVWENFFAIPMDMPSLTTREFSQSGFWWVSQLENKTTNVCQIYL